MSVHGITVVLTLLLSFFDVLVSGCDTKCSDQPTFSKATLVVEYGDSASVNCTVCKAGCENLLFDLEHAVGSTTQVGTEISWTADRVTEWDLQLSCFYTQDSGEQCCSRLPFTLYKLPDQVSFSFKNHTGPLYEYELYTLECNVQNVAPIEKVEAVFYRGDNAFAQVKTTRKLGKKPLDFTFTFDIMPQKYQEGAVYRCEAHMDLGPEGPQPSPHVRSNEISTTVYYKVQKEAEHTSHNVYITEGHQMELNLTSVGNPAPIYTWTLPSGENFTTSDGVFVIKSVSFKDAGDYSCTVSNSHSRFTEEFVLEVIPNYLLYIIVGVLIGLVLLITVVLIIWCRCYKNKHTGQYNLLKMIGLRPAQNAGSSA